jgi:hypothetical protein
MAEQEERETWVSSGFWANRKSRSANVHREPPGATSLPRLKVMVSEAAAKHLREKIAAYTKSYEFVTFLPSSCLGRLLVLEGGTEF